MSLAPAQTIGMQSLRTSMKVSWGALLSPLLILAALIAAAEILKSRGVFPVTVPAPRDVAIAFARDFGTLMFHLGATVRAAAMGFLLAAATAIGIAALGAMYVRSRTIVNNFAVLVYMMPLIALAPVLVVWFGTGPTARVIIAALAAYFPIFVGASQGFRVSDVRTQELFHVMAASRWKRFWLLALPNALPFIFSGLKVAAAGAVLGAIVSEWVGAERGLGVMMVYALFAFNVAQVWLTILVSIAVAIVAFFVVHVVEKIVLTWTPAYSSVGEAELGTPSRSGDHRFLRTAGAFVLFVVALGVAWWLVIVAFKVPSYTLPAPLEVGAALRANEVLLARSLMLTLETALSGLCVSALAAFSLAALFVNYAWIARALMPYAVAIRSVPIVAVAPLITLLWGRGFAAGVVIVVIATFFPIFVNALRGLDSVSESYLELMRVNAASRAKAFWLVRFPFSMPHLFAGFRAAAPVALLGAMLGEWLTGSKGLGYQLLDSMSLQDLPLLWAGMLVSIAAGLIIFWATAASETVVLRKRSD